MHHLHPKTPPLPLQETCMLQWAAVLQESSLLFLPPSSLPHQCYITLTTTGGWWWWWWWYFVSIQLVHVALEQWHHLTVLTLAAAGRTKTHASSASVDAWRGAPRRVVFERRGRRRGRARGAGGERRFVCLSVRLPASLTACLCVCARTDMRGNTPILTRERENESEGEQHTMLRPVQVTKEWWFHTWGAKCNSSPHWLWVR